MATPLAEADKLTHDLIWSGIIEETVEEDPLLMNLPFETVSGFKQIAYNRENDLGSESQYIGVNEEVAESTPTWTQKTETLKILADRMEIDRFVAETKDAVQSVEAAALAGKGKQMMRKFHDTFYYGDFTNKPNEFDGLKNLVVAAQTIENGSGSTGAAGTLAELTQLVTTTRPGRPSMILCNRNMLRRFSNPYIANVQYNINKESFGDLLQVYSEVPIMVSDWILQTEAISSGSFSAKTGGVTTTIFALRWGRGARAVPGSNGVFNVDGILGIQAGPMQVGDAHPLEKKIGWSRQLWWYHSLIMGSTLSLATYDGLTDAAFTV